MGVEEPRKSVQPMAYIYRYENGRFEQFEKPVVREQPLTIFVNGMEIATFLCTPEKLDYLTVGFLAFEGLINRLDEIRELDVDAEVGVVERADRDDAVVALAVAVEPIEHLRADVVDRRRRAALRLVDHSWRQIDRDDVVERAGQAARDVADAASDLDRRAAPGRKLPEQPRLVWSEAVAPRHQRGNRVEVTSDLVR